MTSEPLISFGTDIFSGVGDAFSRRLAQGRPSDDTVAPTTPAAVIPTAPPVEPISPRNDPEERPAPVVAQAPEPDVDLDLDIALSTPASPITPVPPVADPAVVGTSKSKGPKRSRIMKVDFDGNVSQLKQFPQQVIETLRSRFDEAVEAWPGEAVSFPTTFSQAKLVTAYVLAMTGLQLDGLDPQTELAAQVFRAHDRTLTALDEISSSVARQEDAMRRLMLLARSTNTTAQVNEMSLAYLLAESTGTLKTADVIPGTLDVGQPAAMIARGRAQQATMKALRDEAIAKGRPIR